MSKINIPLLDKFKKLDWKKQQKIMLSILGGILLLIFLIAALSLCSSGTEEEQAPENGEDEIVVVQDIYFITAHQNSNINVRKEPSRNSDRVLSILAGDTSVRLKFLGESTFNEDYYWHQVSLPDGSVGWVREDVVIIDETDE